MELKKGLFSFGDLKNHPSRSGFDLSQKKAFTAKAGELLPVYWDIAFPGDKYDLGHQNFTRTVPVSSAAYVRLREYYDWYYVPFRQINKNLPSALVGMEDNPITASGLTTAKAVVSDLLYAPIFNSSGQGYATIDGIISSAAGLADGSPSPVLNFFGFSQAAGYQKLLLYLGYGAHLSYSSNPTTVPSSLITSNLDFFKQIIAQNSLNLTLLPLFAYQKIYSDYFRNTRWEKPQPWCFNADYYTGGNFFSSITSTELRRSYVKSDNIFTLRYANWHKDLYMGALPASQLGEVAMVSISQETSAPITVGSGRAFVRNQDAILYSGLAGETTKPYMVYDGSAMGSSRLRAVVGGSGNVDPANPAQVKELQLSSASGFGFNIIQLRLAEALQRYREVAGANQQTYRDQLYAQWGVTLSPALADTCQYIGGSSSSIDIGEVVNNNLTGDAIADIKGKGVGSGRSRESFTAPDYGVLMCIYHVAPLLDYVKTGPDLMLMETNAQDLPNPMLDNIGMESIPLVSLYNSKGLTTTPIGLQSILGYGPRYIAHKTKTDVVIGAFASTLQNWVAPVDGQYLATWLNNSLETTSDYVVMPNKNWFKINPALLNRVFGVEVDSTWDTDQFWINAFFDVKVVRNLDYDGMPY